MNSDTKKILTWTLGILIVIIVLAIASQAQTKTSVVNTTRYPDGTSVVGKTFFNSSDGRTKISNICMWWDVEFYLTNNGTAGKAYVKLVDASGNEETVAGFSGDGNQVVYDNWHPGAYVFNPDNYYDVFQTGRVVKFNGNRSENLDVNFEMQPYSNFIWNHGATKLKLESEGGLEIFPLSTVTMLKAGMSPCPEDESPHCATICLRNTFWWWTKRNEISRYTVSQFGVSFGNEINASNAVVIQNLNKGNEAGQAAAFQLQFQRQQVPPQDAGWSECYGVTFEPFTVYDSDRTTVKTITSKTMLFEINRLLKVAIKNYNYNDYVAIVKVATILNNVRNCPQ